MKISKKIYISGPRMGTNNQKSNGPIINSYKKKRKKKRK